MFTGKELAAYCEKVYRSGWVYWYGTYGKKCSKSLYESKKKQYPKHYTASRTGGYMKDIAGGKTCADCVGMIKSFFWTGGAFGAEPKYATNHCPDVSANGMIDLCVKKGAIGTMPDIPGLVVWKSGHIGVYVGGGYTVEMKGFNYDCQRNPVRKGPWTKWGMLPSSMISYDDALSQKPSPDGEGGSPQSGETDEVSVSSGLKKGDYGSSVKAMQEALLRWNPTCLPKYGADGDFGGETENAVKGFQKAAGLPETGVYDETTRAALTAWKPAETPEAPRYVAVTGGSVNVRSAPNTAGRVLSVVHAGDKLPYQGQDSPDGWHLVEYKNENAWISGRYSRLEA